MTDTRRPHATELKSLSRQLRLAARPVGQPKPPTSRRRGRRSRARRRRVRRRGALHLARPGDARLDERGPVLHPAGRDRRGDARGRASAAWSRRSHPGFAVGDHVSRARSACRSTRVSDGTGVTKVDPALAPLPVYLGTLGMPGMTAYFGLLDVGQPEAGRDRGGLRRRRRGRHGRRPDREDQGLPRRRHRRRRREVPLARRRARLRRRDRLQGRRRPAARCASTAPTGVDVYFDNVGGEILDAVLRASRAARASSSAARSRSTTTPSRVEGPGELPVAAREPRAMAGMVVFDYADRYRRPSPRWRAGWPRAGSSARTRRRRHRDLPDALIRLFSGENTGKLVLELKR